MRAIVTIACAGVLVATAAHAQDALKLCRQLKDDGERLKCYDGIDIASPNPAGSQAQRQQGGGPAWLVTDERSPLDDSPLVSAALQSTDGKSHLLMRCKDRKTEVAVSIRGFIKCGTDVRVVYRLDQEQATDGPWNSHPSCYLALAPSPIPFIRALSDEGKVYVRMFDHHGVPHDAQFNLGKVSPVRSRLAEACDWDKASENPAPKAPAPAASPSTKGRPK